ncbi:MAG: Hsp20/alpha crystallin family protein [Chitinophagaceae bacterium]
MTFVNLKTLPNTRVINNLMDNFFEPSSSMLRNGVELPTGKQSVPVNILESENAYHLNVVAPGFQKESFSINLEKEILTITGELKEKESEKEEKQVRMEHKIHSFKRSFTVDELIDAEKISAEYVNGILSLNLPKKAPVKPSVKQISVQ